MKLSVVDQSPVSEGFTPADALRNTIDLARLTDRLGYTRYWIAEHHGISTFASPAPEILISRVAAETEVIRVGSGAVLLPHYAPLKVAEQFGMLHALYKDRIDLGIGRAPGGNGLVAHALRARGGGNEDDFMERLLELRAFMEKDFPASHPYQRLQVTPEMPGAPELWLLGTSMTSAATASRLGLPYAFAHFILPQQTRSAISYYHTHFAPSATLSKPQAIVALGVVCADTEAEAQRLFASTRLFRSRIQQNRRGPIVPPEQALRELADSAVDPMMDEVSEWARYVVGAPEQVKAQLDAIAEALQVEEIMVVTIVHDHAARLRSYELLADVYGLPRR